MKPNLSDSMRPEPTGQSPRPREYVMPLPAWYVLFKPEIDAIARWWRRLKQRLS